MNRPSAVGLSALVLSALLALGNFGYTMLTSAPSAAPTMPDTSAVVEQTASAPERTDAIDRWIASLLDLDDPRSSARQDRRGRGRH